MEVGEKFIIREGPVDYACIINQSGEPELSYWKISYAINHPESIIRAPRLTDPEIAIMRAVGAKWVSRNENTRLYVRVTLWAEKPEKSEKGVFYGDGSLACVNTELFPSVHPGDCISAEEAT